MEVGEYRVLRKIGEGGMGAVYAAVHPVIGKRVAIKVLAPHIAKHPELVRRFVDEARAVNKIGHPNIVDIFSFGWLPDQRHYFAMEYLEGQNLSDRMKAGPIAIDEARRLLRPDLQRARGGAPDRDRPPRPQARQHLGRAAAARRLVREAARLRHRQAARRRRRGARTR